MNNLHFELNFVFYKCCIILYRAKICIKLCFDEFIPCQNYEINIRTMLFMVNWYVYGIHSVWVLTSLCTCVVDRCLFLFSLPLCCLSFITLLILIWYLHDSDYPSGIFMILIIHLVSS